MLLFNNDDICEEECERGRNLIFTGLHRCRGVRVEVSKREAEAITKDDVENSREEEERTSTNHTPKLA